MLVCLFALAAQASELEAQDAPCDSPCPVLGEQMTDPTRIFPLPLDSDYGYEDGFGDGRSASGRAVRDRRAKASGSFLMPPVYYNPSQWRK